MQKGRKQVRFVVLFRSFDLTFFPFAIEKKGLCDPTLPFVKTIGPEVYKGEILIMLVSKVTVAVEAWAFCSFTRHARLSVPTNLTANLNARKRSDAMTILKKRRYLYLYQPPSEIRPLVVAGAECYWRPKRG